MAKSAAVFSLVAVIVAAALVAEAPSKAEAACNPMNLLPCASAFMSGGVKPSTGCCDKLKEQKPCLCEFKKNPDYQTYVNSPAAKKMASECGVNVDC